MKKIALALVLAAVSGAALAEWVKLDESDQVHSYIDPATIRKDGNLRRVWEIHRPEATRQSWRDVAADIG